MKPYTVGLTGGIGSGKSVVAGLFAKRGVAVIDTDEIAHELTRPGGEAIGAIRAEFGAGLIGADGALDRGGMRGVDRSRYARVLVVDCPEAQQVERAMRRSGLSEMEVRAILAAQATREQRLAQADDVIDNSGTPEALERQVSHLNEKYLTLAGRSKTTS